jgi:hypothetical protein
MTELTREEDDALERYASKWTSQGYRLLKNPHGVELPEFLGSYRPDAVLLAAPGSSSDNILVEVLYKGQTDAQRKIEAVRPLLAGRSGWRLDVLYAGVAPPTLVPTSKGRVRDTLASIEGMNESDPGAFVMLWPVLEAIARILSPDQTRRPQSPGRVVELLASEGHVSPNEADILRRAANLRNRLIHGDLDAQVTPDLRKATQRIARNLVRSLEAPATAAE